MQYQNFSNFLLIVIFTLSLSLHYVALMQHVPSIGSLSAFLFLYFFRCSVVPIYCCCLLLATTSSSSTAATHFQCWYPFLLLLSTHQMVLLTTYVALQVSSSVFLLLQVFSSLFFTCYSSSVCYCVIIAEIKDIRGLIKILLLKLRRIFYG